MLEITSSAYYDPRTSKWMFSLTMKNGGNVSTSLVDYDKLLNKNQAEAELSRMIVELCEHVYKIENEIKYSLFKN